MKKLEKLNADAEGKRKKRIDDAEADAKEVRKKKKATLDELKGKKQPVPPAVTKEVKKVLDNPETKREIKETVKKEVKKQVEKVMADYQE